MPFRRTSLLVLVIICGMFGWPSGPRVARVPARAESVRPTVDNDAPASIATFPSRPQDVATLRPWRYRLKSVLTESDHRTSYESMLDLVPPADRPDRTAPQRPLRSPLRPVTFLRC